MDEKIKIADQDNNSGTVASYVAPLLYKIHNEDCRTTLAKLPPECVDLVVTSPPYDELRTYKGHKWNFEIFMEIAEGLSRVLKQGGVIVWVVNDQTINGSETLTSCKQKIYFRENCGLNIHDTMFYQRQPRFPDDKRYQNAIEYMFVLSKGIPKTINLIADKPNLTAGTTRVGASERNINGSMRESWLSKTKGTIKEFGVRNNIWEYQTGYNQSSKDKEAFEHPAIFPEALAEDHIRSWSNEDDIVYDPFSGSGTTCKVADRLGRAWFGSEIAEEYQSVALRRIGNDLFTKASN